MAIIQPIASFRTTLTQKLSDSGTSFKIQDVTDDAGNSLDGLKIGFTLNKGTTKEEYIIGTLTASTKTVSIDTRGVDTSDGTTNVSSLQNEHEVGSIVEITSHPYLVLAMRVLNGTDAFGGVPQNPSARTISNARDLIDKEYADAISASTLNAFLVTDNGALTVNVGAGRLVTGDGTVDYAGDSNQSLTDDTDNYLELDDSGGLQINTTGWTQGYVPLAKVTTASGDITVIDDARGWLTAPNADTSITDDLTYGATISAGDVLYVDTGDGKLKLADASAEATADGTIYIALDAGVDTDTGKRVIQAGQAASVSGTFSAGWVFLSDTAGEAASSAGTYRRVIGYSPDGTNVWLIPGQSADELTGGNSDLTVANLNEAATFFANTDITGAQAETLTDGSLADSLHSHELFELVKTEQDTNTETTVIIDDFEDFTENLTGSSAVRNELTETIVETDNNSGSDAIIERTISIDSGNSFGTTTVFDQNQELTFRGQLSDNTSQDIFMGLYGDTLAAIPADATSTTRHAGFYIEDGTLNASIADGTTQETSQINGITLTNKNTYHIIFVAGARVEFYVNGSLEATLNTNVPPGGVLVRMTFGVTTQANDYRGVKIENNVAYKLTT